MTKPTWTIFRKVHLEQAYAEYHEGPGTAVYYFFKGQFHYSWESLEKALKEAHD